MSFEKEEILIFRRQWESWTLVILKRVKNSKNEILEEAETDSEIYQEEVSKGIIIDLQDAKFKKI